jgi:hypothetical protein
MSRRSLPSRRLRAPRQRTSGFARALLLALLSACVLASPASATTGHGPKYDLKIVSGETPYPEFEQVSGTSGGVQPEAQVAVSIIRGGITVYRDVQNGGGAGLSQVPQLGDVVTLESPVGTLIASVVYDGLPTTDPTVCAGSTNFSGQNSPGDTVEGYFVSKVLRFNSSGRAVGVHQIGFGEAQVKTLSGTTFGGNFLLPLTLGETVGAVESLKTPLANEATYTYTSENLRPVTACPVPPPVSLPPPPPVFGGSLVKLFSGKIRGFLKSGARDQVSIDLPGTVTQDLYLAGGKLPAFAAATKSKHKKKKPPPALLLARGTAVAKSAGTVTVQLRLTSKGRRKLKSVHSAKAVLITTLRSNTGVKITLGRRSISLHR